MSNIEIHEHMYSWIKFFLKNRTMQTKMNDALSSKEVMEEGPPQGLFVTLFLIYISDMEEVLDML